jgi:hypothetical protein
MVWQRGTVERYVASHRVQWELGMGCLTGVYVILSFVEDTAGLGLDWLTLTLLSLAGAFLVEFTFRFLDSEHRIRYLRNHWLDLFTAIPFIGPLRALRFLRIVRFVRLGLAIRQALTAHNGHRRGGDDVTWLIWPFLLLFWLGASYAVWMFEGGINPVVPNFASSMFVTFLTASTVGYGGGFSPHSVGGKITAGLIVFVAIGLVGFGSARLTARFVGDHAAQMPLDIAAMRRDIFDLKRSIEGLEKVLRLSADPELSADDLVASLATTRGDTIATPNGGGS